MISPMTKYSFILLSGQTEEFLSKIQDLGVIDITRSLAVTLNRKRASGSTVILSRLR